jgi:hypothetical protein
MGPRITLWQGSSTVTGGIASLSGRMSGGGVTVCAGNDRERTALCALAQDIISAEAKPLADAPQAQRSNVKLGLARYGKNHSGFAPPERN